MKEAFVTGVGPAMISVRFFFLQYKKPRRPTGRSASTTKAAATQSNPAAVSAVFAATQARGRTHVFRGVVLSV